MCATQACSTLVYACKMKCLLLGKRHSNFKNIQCLYLIALIWGEGLRQCKEFTPFQLNYADEVLEAVNW